MSDLKIFFKHCMRTKRYGVSDPEYFLANFIFYAKLCNFVENHGSGYKPWELGYGVCGEGCIHGDLEYVYEIDVQSSQVTIKHYSFNDEDWDAIFCGPLEEAIKRYGSKYPNGCHIDEAALIALEMGK